MSDVVGACTLLHAHVYISEGEVNVAYMRWNFLNFIIWIVVFER